MRPLPACTEAGRRAGDSGPVSAAPAEAGLGARPRLRYWRALAPILVLVLLTAFVLAWSREISVETIVALHDRFHEVLAAHPIVSVLGYVAAYAVLASLSVPACGLVTAAGGLMFGWLIGGAAAVAGATTGATVVFLIARSAVGSILDVRTTPWLLKLRQGFKEDALSYLLFLRLVPAFPFWFVNVAPAILGVPLRTYVIGTLLGIIPATFAFASAGAGLESVILAAKAEHLACLATHAAEACKLSVHASSLLTRELVLALVLLGTVALVPVAVRRWRNTHAAAK